MPGGRTPTASGAAAVCSSAATEGARGLGGKPIRPAKELGVIALAATSTVDAART